MGKIHAKKLQLNWYKSKTIRRLNAWRIKTKRMEKNIIIIIISRIIGCEHLAFRIETPNLFKDCWLNAKSQKVSQSGSRVLRVTLIIWCVLSKLFHFWFIWQRRARTERNVLLQAIIIAMWKMLCVYRDSFFFVCLCIFWHQKEDFPDIWIGSNAFCTHKYSSDAIWLNFLKYYTSFDFVITVIKSYLYSSLVVSRKC